MKRGRAEGGALHSVARVLPGMDHVGKPQLTVRADSQPLAEQPRLVAQRRRGGGKRRLESNDLLLFARVAEAGSFSRAAQRLELPVSTVSRHIADLETRLGERLFLRSTRKLTITQLGNALLEHARQVVDGVDAASELADNRQLKPSGRLRVSAPPNLMLLESFFVEFLVAYPSITLQLDFSMRAVDIIAEGFDVALRVGELRDDAALAARPIVELHGGLYASPAYLESHGTPKEPEDLLAHHAVHSLSRTGEALPWVLMRGKARWEGLPPARAIVNSPDLMLRLAIDGTGITLAEHRRVEPYLKAGEVVRVLPEWSLPRAPLWAVFPGRKLMPARTRIFIDALAARFADQRSSSPGGEVFPALAR
ncbi:MAG TPA: LysR family transcriptional regulator [Burkholderiales bacterium]|nr:LysR family transcriptional regulator [Burkholderiales bacterium]